MSSGDERIYRQNLQEEQAKRAKIEQVAELLLDRCCVTLGNGSRLKNALAAEKAEQAGGAADGAPMAADPPQKVEKLGKDHVLPEFAT